MKPNIDISDKNREAIAGILNTLLADEYLLYTQTRNAHWNIEGSNFMELHKFFEGQYEAIDETMDAVAERVRTLGHYSLGTLAEFLEVTHLAEVTGLSDQKTAIKTLLQSHEVIICNSRKDIMDINDKYKDLGTADFITGIMEEHEKMAWMLRSYLA